MTENAVHAAPVAVDNSPKAPGFGARHKRGFLTAAIIGLLLALLGALETNLIPLVPRLLYWEVLMLCGATIALGVTEGVERWGGLRHLRWLEWALIAVLMAVPMTIMVIGASNVFFQFRMRSWESALFMFGATAIISFAMTTLNGLLHGDDRAAPAPLAVPPPAQKDPAESHEASPRFSDRLPLGQRALPIIALEAEDHYLRVHFAGGQSTLVLLRLSDAISEMPADLGAQTHRSWWVAQSAVRAVSKADGRATLTLEGGITAPVSRSFYKQLGVLGWLA